MFFATRLIYPAPRAEVMDLLGWRAPAAGTTGGQVEFIQIGRWLVRKRLVRRFMLSPQYRVVDFLRLRRRSFDRDAVPGNADLVMIRNEGRPKACIFDLKGRTKEVRLLYAFDYHQEMTAMNIFLENGIRCPKLVETNGAENRYLQRLVCDPLARQAKTSVADAGIELQRFIARCRPSVRKLGIYQKEYQVALRRVENFMSKDIHDALSRRAADCSNGLGVSSDAGIPVIQCHGDYSSGNVVRGDDGKYYLLDLDRSFEAAAFFDVMYFGFSNDLPRNIVIKYLQSVDSAFSLGLNLNGEKLFELANYLYLLDLTRFLRLRIEGISDMEDRVCKYTIGLLEKAL